MGQIELPTQESCKPQARTCYVKKIAKVAAFGLISLYGVSQLSRYSPKPFAGQQVFQSSPLSDDLTGLCKQIAPAYPPGYSNSTLDLFKSQKLREKALANFAGALQIPTESYDDMDFDVGKEPRFEIFSKFHSYLESTYPLVFSNLSTHKPNTYGLVHIWEGSDPSLKPIVLMAHQDVVPVLPDTIDLWTQAPYEGFFDGEFIWGRGAVDCKNTLTSIYDAVSLLLETGYSPERTVILSFGFDEEVGGYRGAKSNAEFLRNIYGSDYPFLSIFDEGMGMVRSDSVNIAPVTTMEKGMMSLKVTVHTPGGHSSMPPDHTGIGKLAQVIAKIENTPFAPELDSFNPMFEFMQCIAVNSNSITKEYKKAIANIENDKASKKIVMDAMSEDILLKYLIRTSQAVDIITGGLKINALPEKVEFQINHRIDVHSNKDDVLSKIFHNVKSVAAQYGMGIKVDGEYVYGEESPAGYFEIEEAGWGMNPSPQSPTSGPAWELIAGTIKHVFEDFGGVWTELSTGDTSAPGDPVIVAPSVMSGNTDTKHFWDLSQNIYRFGPFRPGNFYGFHTVDERISLDAHMEAIVFYHQYILNANA